jgi:hypothetical protein
VPRISAKGNLGHHGFWIADHRLPGSSFAWSAFASSPNSVGRGSAAYGFFSKISDVPFSSKTFARKRERGCGYSSLEDSQMNSLPPVFHLEEACIGAQRARRH